MTSDSIHAHGKSIRKSSTQSTNSVKKTDSNL